MNDRTAAVVLIERGQRVLVVWNRRYFGWTLPGGLVEEGESPDAAACRELHEETGLMAVPSDLRPLYEAPTVYAEGGFPNRGSRVHVFEFSMDDLPKEPREMEPGCPVSWFTHKDWMASNPFRKFYEKMFETLGKRP